jgi:hypothetical protein
MKPGRRRWLLRVVLLLAAGLGLLFWAILEQFSGSLVIENDSGQRIATLQVIVGGETHSYVDIATGSSVSVPFGEDWDASLRVSVTLANGTRLLGDFSPVRNVRKSGRPRLLVKPTGLEPLWGKR